MVEKESRTPHDARKVSVRQYPGGDALIRAGENDLDTLYLMSNEVEALRDILSDLDGAGD